MYMPAPDSGSLSSVKNSGALQCARKVVASISLSLYLYIYIYTEIDRYICICPHRTLGS